MEVSIVIIKDNKIDFGNTFNLQRMLYRKNIKVIEKRSSDSFNWYVVINAIQTLYDIAECLWDVYVSCGKKEGIKFMVNKVLLLQNPTSKEQLFEELKNKLF